MKNNFLKGFLPFICVIVFAISLFVVNKFTFSFVSAETPPSSFEGGEGSEESPWQISSASQLVYLSSQVNSVTDFSKNKYFILTKNIDLSEVNWIPIGGVYSTLGGVSFVGSFQGVFDGNGCKIQNMNILNNAENPLSNLGLFGYAKNSVIKNLAVEGVSISVGDAIVTANQTNVIVGGLVGKSENTDIRNCFVCDVDEDEDITAKVFANINFGGLVGQMSGRGIYNSYSSLSINAVTKSIYEINENIGGLVGQISSVEIFNSYSTSNLAMSNEQSTNSVVLLRIGGLVGFVFDSYSAIKNNFYAGSISFVDKTNVTEQVGAIIGSLKSGFVPIEGAIDFCHYVSTTIKNVNLNAIGRSETYVVSSLRFDILDDALFKNKTTFENNSYWLDDKMFDFQTNWTIQDGYPLLQQFLFYIVEVENNNIVSISFSSGETIIDELTGEPYANKRQFKAGQQVVLTCALNTEFERFYDVDYWEKGQSKIVGTDKSMAFSFPCSYSTAGLYSVELSAKLFSISITVDESSKDELGNEFGKIRIDGALFQPINQKMEFGRSLSLKAEPKVDYAFEGWYQGSTRISDNSQLTLVVGSSTASFSEDLSLKMTAKFVRSNTKITITLSDNSGGRIKIEGDDDFTDETLVANKIINSTIKLVAEAKEGFKFVGWYALAGDNVPLSQDLEYSYTLSEPEQSVFAKFASIDAVVEENDGLSGWAIFGIIAGGLALAGAVVGIIVAVKRKNSYKSGFNF